MNVLYERPFRKTTKIKFCRDLSKFDDLLQKLAEQYKKAAKSYQFAKFLLKFSLFALFIVSSSKYCLSNRPSIEELMLNEYIKFSSNIININLLFSPKIPNKFAQSMVENEEALPIKNYPKIKCEHQWNNIPTKCFKEEKPKIRHNGNKFLCLTLRSRKA